MNLNQKKYETAGAEPDASSMIETFRAIGYSIETAVADIIDNSISADAKNIWFEYDWEGSKSIILIKDDGHGMNNDEIIQAMRPGSRHPSEVRDRKDLGRFGLGLKTSSFSQTRKFTLLSKRNGGEVNYWAWDLDYVNDIAKKWELIKYVPYKKPEIHLAELSSGTTVVWYDIDRLFKGEVSVEDTSALSKFMEIMESVKVHLSIVFHRFIETNRIRIYFQNRLIEAWDPYLRGEPGTQALPDEEIQEGKVKIKGYVLPYKSKLSDEKFKKAGGPKGWNAHQGFYIYRNERLLVAGEWLQMFKKEEHYKLARIMIDLPNNIDNEWQIDIKKSVARPPLNLKDQMKAYASEVRFKAVEVYRHKGKALQRKYPSLKFTPVWMEKQRHGKRYYALNREHPVIKSLLNEFENKRIEDVLKIIEETVPIPLITIRESEEPESHGIPFEGTNHDTLLLKMKELYDNLLSYGRNKDQALAVLLSIEPFDKYPQYIETLKL